MEPIEYTPRWVHFDDRNLNYACSRGGYPLIRQGSKGVYVLIAQDALTRLGFSTYGIDGIFGNNTLSAVRRFQTMYGISVDGIIGCNTWTLLTNSVVGIG